MDKHRGVEHLLFTIFGIFLTLHNGNSQCIGDNDDSPLLRSAPLNLYRGQQEFTISLLDAINKATPNENIFFSPYSTYHALLLAYFGAKNITEQELKKALKLDWANTKVQVQQAYRFEKQRRAMRMANSLIEFSSVDRIFLSKQVQLRQCMKSLFDDELEHLDFQSNPEQCRQDINSWVANLTRNEITDVLNPGDVTSNTNLILANAAYFKGKWESKFDPADTKKEIFYTSSDKQVLVDMMKKEGTFNLGINERLGAHVLEMPYQTRNSSMEAVSMVIILPPFRKNGMDQVLQELTPEVLKAALMDSNPREINVAIPKFSFEQKIELKPVLQHLGINTLFDRSQIDLSDFSETEKLGIDDARHVAKIKVDEEGSTAAAATVLFSFRSARPLEPTKLVCDHPFLFLIYDHKSSAILFAGIYRDPTAQN